jgi:hypothetical protein
MEQRGQRKQKTPQMPVISLQKGIFLLTMKLHGDNADHLCNEMADKIGRLLAGHPSIVDEVYANMHSALGVHRVMRAAIPVEETQVITYSNVKRLVIEQCQHMEQEFKRRRKMVLNDRKNDEKSKEKEHVRALQILHEQQKLADKEKEKLALERDIKFKEIDLDTLKINSETKKAELEIEKTKLEKQVVPTQVHTKPTDFRTFVTISRVAEYFLPIDTLQEKFRMRVLQRAGRMASDHLLPYTHKIKDIWDKYKENCYSDSDFDKLSKYVQQAYKEERDLLL